MILDGYVKDSASDLQVVGDLFKRLPDFKRRRSMNPTVKEWEVVLSMLRSVLSVSISERASQRVNRVTGRHKSVSSRFLLKHASNMVSLLFSFQYAGTKNLPLNYTSMAQSFYTRSLSALSKWAASFTEEVRRVRRNESFLCNIILFIAS